jgi:hypothetical protein
VAVLLLNSNEGGSNGVTLTPLVGGNTGGASGNFWDAVTIGAGCVDAFDNTRAAHGTLSTKISSAATAATSYNQWSTSAGSITKPWWRMAMYFTALPAASHRIWSAFQTATLCCAFRLGTDARVTFLDSLAAVGVQTTNPVPLNQWFRLEGFLIGSSTTGQMELKIFSNVDDVSPLETLTSAATLNLFGVPNVYRYGLGSNLANAGPWWQDDYGLSDTGYIGPVGTAVAPNLTMAPITGY